VNDSEDCPEGWGRGGAHATGGVVVDGAGAEVAGAEVAGAEVAGAEPAGDVVAAVVAGRAVGCGDELLQPVETNATMAMSARVRERSRLGVFMIP
jgi:hypothetical protein